ncbi:unnamed protein product, partial [Coccothraustes coccothraustes]
RPGPGLLLGPGRSWLGPGWRWGRAQLVAGEEALLGGSWGSFCLGQCSKSPACLLQVPAIVRRIHQ